MARTTDQPSTANRRNTATAQLDTNLSDSFDEQDRQGGDGQIGDNAERRENLTAVRDERDNERNDSRTTPARTATSARTSTAATTRGGRSSARTVKSGASTRATPSRVRGASSRSSIVRRLGRLRARARGLEAGLQVLVGVGGNHGEGAARRLRQHDRCRQHDGQGHQRRRSPQR